MPQTLLQQPIPAGDGALSITLGQASSRGIKALNQDFHGACIPEGAALNSKGIAVALADGISSSNVSQIASETAVSGFLSDYYCTSDAWSVKHSAQRVLASMNAWLYSQTRQSPYRFDRDRGYVCTFTTLILKSATAHVFHVGDARVYRLRAGTLELLTRDHRTWLSSTESHLNRALGVSPHIEIDYQAHSLEPGDVFLLATDGTYEFLSDEALMQAMQAADPQQGADIVLGMACRNGSDDNLTVQIVRVDTLPLPHGSEIQQIAKNLPLPPDLAPRTRFEGYRIVPSLHASSRSHVYLATDALGKRVALKTPSIDQQEDHDHLERFLLEEWIARRIDSPYVLKPHSPDGKRDALYIAMEYVEGQTLRQWMIDNPEPDLETVRGIVEQIARGLRAFHRLEMLHQDLRPDNVMLDTTGTVRIIDFGSVHVAGVTDNAEPRRPRQILGTAQYTAPEYFLGDAGTPRSDLFSLGVIAYQMLTGALPYGMGVAKTRSRAAQKRLVYDTACRPERTVPEWVDGALRRAVAIDPGQRYPSLSEFLYDLRHPNPRYVNSRRRPLAERHPVGFWKSVALVLALIVVAQFVLQA